MGTRLRARAVVLVASLAVLAACAPLPGSGPAPPPIDSGDPPTSPLPVVPANAYAATIDPAGDAPPQVVTFQADDEAEKQAKIAELAQQGAVVAVDNDHPITALTVNQSNDPFYRYQYALSRTYFPYAWNPGGPTGAGVTIAIVDTGTLGSHQDLGFSKVVVGQDYVQFPGTGRADPNGHGTHVAGIAAAADNTVGGVGGAPGATILPVRVLNANGGGTTSAAANGVHLARARGADVINLSFGGPSDDANLKYAVALARYHGIPVVAAAGNNGTGGADVYPAAYDNYVLAVGATNSANQRASYSSDRPYVDIAAPGTHIVSTYRNLAPWPVNGAYRYLSGTSMSAPLVSGAIALLIQKCGSPANSAEVTPLYARVRAAGTLTTGFSGSVRQLAANSLVGICPY